MSPWHVVLVALAGWLNREQQKTIEYLKEENRVLREQLGAKRLRFNDEQRRRLAVKGKELGIKMLRELGCIVNPDTILRWYRELIAMKYDGSEHRRPGRPSKPDELRELVVRMAQENPGWGYTRIRDALGNLGHEIARNTIKAILKTQDIQPAPERSKRISWKTFLRSHWAAIAACDFFTVEVLTWTGLTRFYVLFVIELATRRIELAGIIHQPHGAWMLQVARNLLDSVDGFLKGKRFLLLDRDPLYTSQVRTLLSSAGVTPIRLPPSSPNLNAYAERFVRSIKSECLDKLVLLGEGHLRAAVREYVAHYHEERNHQGLGGQLILPPPTSTGPARSSAGSALAACCASITERRPEPPRSSFCTLRGFSSVDSGFASGHQRPRHADRLSAPVRLPGWRAQARRSLDRPEGPRPR